MHIYKKKQYKLSTLLLCLTVALIAPSCSNRNPQLEARGKAAYENYLAALGQAWETEFTKIMEDRTFTRTELNEARSKLIDFAKSQAPNIAEIRDYIPPEIEKTYWDYETMFNRDLVLVAAVKTKMLDPKYQIQTITENSFTREMVKDTATNKRYDCVSDSQQRYDEDLMPTFIDETGKDRELTICDFLDIESSVSSLFGSELAKIKLSKEKQTQ